MYGLKISHVVQITHRFGALQNPDRRQATHGFRVLQNPDRRQARYGIRVLQDPDSRQATYGQTHSTLFTCTLQNILVAGKPHLGTDRLIKILQAFRKHLIALGVQIHFGSCVTDLVVEHNQAVGVKLRGQQLTKNMLFLVLCEHVLAHRPQPSVLCPWACLQASTNFEVCMVINECCS